MAFMKGQMKTGNQQKAAFNHTETCCRTSWSLVHATKFFF